MNKLKTLIGKYEKELIGAAIVTAIAMVIAGAYYIYKHIRWSK